MKALQYKELDYDLSNVENNMLAAINIAILSSCRFPCNNTIPNGKVWNIAKFILTNDIGCPLSYITNGTFYNSFESLIVSEKLMDSWCSYHSMREEFPRHVVQIEFLRSIYENEERDENVIFNITEDGTNDFIFIF